MRHIFRAIAAHPGMKVPDIVCRGLPRSRWPVAGAPTLLWLRCLAAPAHAASVPAHRRVMMHASKAEMGGKWYAVSRGREVGLFPTWAECKKRTDGYPSASFKSFPSQREALAWLAASGVGGQPVAAAEDSSAGKGKQSSASTLAGMGKQGRVSTLPPGQQPPSNLTLQPYVAAPATYRIHPGAVYRVEFDGGCRGNPGLIGYGAVLREHSSGLIVGVCAGTMQRGTNNRSEYLAAILGLKAALQLGMQQVVLQGDSEVVLKQLTGEYKVSAQGGLLDLWTPAMALKDKFTKVHVTHVERALNAGADQLSNLAMDVGEMLADCDRHSDSQGLLQLQLQAEQLEQQAAQLQQHQAGGRQQGVQQQSGWDSGVGPQPVLPTALTAALSGKLLRAALADAAHRRGKAILAEVSAVATAMVVDAPSQAQGESLAAAGALAVATKPAGSRVAANNGEGSGLAASNGEGSGLAASNGKGSNTVPKARRINRAQTEGEMTAVTKARRRPKVQVAAVAATPAGGVDGGPSGDTPAVPQADGGHQDDHLAIPEAASTHEKPGTPGAASTAQEPGMPVAGSTAQGPGTPVAASSRPQQPGRPGAANSRPQEAGSAVAGGRPVATEEGVSVPKKRGRKPKVLQAAI